MEIHPNLVRWIGFLCACAFKPGQCPVYTAGTQKQGALPAWLACVFVTIILPHTPLSHPSCISSFHLYSMTAFTWFLAVCLCLSFLVLRTDLDFECYFCPSFIGPDSTWLIVSATSSNHLLKKIPATNITSLISLSTLVVTPLTFPLCACSWGVLRATKCVCLIGELSQHYGANSVTPLKLQQADESPEGLLKCRF